MLTSSRPLLRRRGTGHVVKYLEGVPTPTKLIDHLAGANLHASAEIPFFTTVPRYIDTQREQRLSRLYFHHVLYPAGGARLPYQAVVVRGGRAVRASVTHLLRVKKETNGALQQPEKEKSAASTSTAARRLNPLAVPCSQLGLSSPAPASSVSLKTSVTNTIPTTPTEDVPAAGSWARADPARRMHFSTGTPHRRAHHPTKQRSPEVNNRPTRAVEDTLLSPLRGALEHFWNELKTANSPLGEGATGGSSDASLPASHTMAERVRQLLVSPAAGLLWHPAPPHRSNAVASEKSMHIPVTVTNNSEQHRLWEDLMMQVQKRVAALRMHAGTETRAPATVRTFLYAQTRLPPSATVALPLAQVREYVHDSKQAEEHLHGRDIGYEDVVCRISGDLMPVVPFAVGRPLTSAVANGAALSLSDRLFAHVTCLTRLSVSVSLPPLTDVCFPATAHNDPGTSHEWTGSRKPAAVDFVKEAVPRTCDSTSISAEPWRLGGVGLDLMIPLHARTASEGHLTKPSVHTNRRLMLATQQNGTPTATAKENFSEAGRYVCGRTDAETYLLPQRELLLTLHVPISTEDMCARQNQERLRRQVRIGRTSRATLSAAWPMDQVRLTSSRRAVGQYTNTMCANESDAYSSALPPPKYTAFPSPSNMPLLLSRTCYEVLALPGDVVYIPRGWGFDVQRIIGTATIQTGNSSGERPGGQKLNVCDHRAFGAKKRSSLSDLSATLAQSNEAADVRHCAGSEGSVQLTSVEVDALCLNYHPYPELTEEQAAVYVAANYVHSGVVDFYERGGNCVYRSYQ